MFVVTVEGSVLECLDEQVVFGRTVSLYHLLCVDDCFPIIFASNIICLYHSVRQVEESKLVREPWTEQALEVLGVVWASVSV